MCSGAFVPAPRRVLTREDIALEGPRPEGAHMSEPVTRSRKPDIWGYLLPGSLLGFEGGGFMMTGARARSRVSIINTYT